MNHKNLDKKIVHVYLYISFLFSWSTHNFKLATCEVYIFVQRCDFEVIKHRKRWQKIERRGDQKWSLRFDKGEPYQDLGRKEGQAEEGVGAEDGWA